MAFGKERVVKYHQRTDSCAFVRIKRIKIPKSDSGAVPTPPEKISKMAIGVPGGFSADSADKEQFDFKHEHKIVLLPDFQEFELEDEKLPLAVQMSAKAVIKAEGALKMSQLEAQAGTWEGEMVEESKFAKDLLQLENPKKIPPKGLFHFTPS